jgi:hypothetical protein
MFIYFSLTTPKTTKINMPTILKANMFEILW